MDINDNHEKVLLACCVQAIHHVLYGDGDPGLLPMVGKTLHILFLSTYDESPFDIDVFATGYSQEKGGPEGYFFQSDN